MSQGWMVVILSMASLGLAAFSAPAADLKVGDPAPPVIYISEEEAQAI